MRYFVITILGVFFSIQEFNAQGKIFREVSAISIAERQAILILPGFGSKVHGTKKIAKFFKQKGYDVFLPKYISRKSVENSVKNLDRFILRYKLKDYKKLHVFSYIFGTWVINNWIEKNGRNNIATIIFDRSPLQERAPKTLLEDLPLISKVLFGNVMRDFCNVPYSPVTDSLISKGIFIEMFSTKLIYKHKETAFKNGKVTFEVNALNQPFEDYCYIPLNHDEMYSKLDVFGNEVLNFINEGRFSKEIKQNSFVENPFCKFERK